MTKSPLQAGRAVLSAALLAGAAAGCASSVDVTQAFAPKDAAQIPAARMQPVAILRDKERIAIPENAKVEADRVVVGGTFVHKLGPSDIIEKDADGRIVAVRRGGETLVRFVPGTAVSPEDSDEVRGQPADQSSGIALKATDRIEMTGTFATDDKVPGGGHVETRRTTSLLVVGAVFLALSYVPTAYVGAASSRSGDRVLLVPVAGPFIDLVGRPACVPPAGSASIGIDPCLPETAGRVALYISGGIQLISAVVAAFGLPARTEVVYSDRGVARAPTKPTFSILPFTTGRGGGAAAFGTF